MFAMNRVTYGYRLKFTKTDKMRFIGHLDLLTYFQRAIKRANIPIAFSMGFNPHQLMSFTVPLPLGMASYAEYLDIRLEEKMPAEDIKTRLNVQMSDGVAITDIRPLREREDTGAALVAAADYTIELDFKDDSFGERLKALEEEKEWNIEKLGKKKKLKSVDIRPMVYGLICENAEKTTLYTRLATGSNSNLKVDLLLKYIYSRLGAELDYLKIRVTRTEMYRDHDGEFVPLMK